MRGRVRFCCVAVSDVCEKSEFALTCVSDGTYSPPLFPRIPEQPAVAPHEDEGYFSPLRTDDEDMPGLFQARYPHTGRVRFALSEHVAEAFFERAERARHSDAGYHVLGDPIALQVLCMISGCELHKFVCVQSAPRVFKADTVRVAGHIELDVVDLALTYPAADLHDWHAPPRHADPFYNHGTVPRRGFKFDLSWTLSVLHLFEYQRPSVQRVAERRVGEF